MKMRLANLILFSLLFISIQAKIQKTNKFAQNNYLDETPESVSSNYYESELTKLKAEIRNREEQLAKITREINSLKESEVKASAMFEIAKKSSIAKSLDDNPIEKSDSPSYSVKNHKVQYACNQK